MEEDEQVDVMMGDVNLVFKNTSIFRRVISDRGMCNHHNQGVSFSGSHYAMIEHIIFCFIGNHFYILLLEEYLVPMCLLGKV